MRSRHRNVVLAAVGLAALGALYLGCRPRLDGAPPRSRSGARIVYSMDLERVIERQRDELGRELTPGEAEAARASALRQAVAVMRERIDERGIDRPSVLAHGEQIVVELPGLDEDTEATVRSLLTRTAVLEFKLVVSDTAVVGAIGRHVGLAPQPNDSVASALGIEAEFDTWRIDETGERRNDSYLIAHDRDDRLSFAEARAAGCRALPQPDGQVPCPRSGRQVLETYLGDLGRLDPAMQPAPGFQFGYQRIEPSTDAPAGRPYWRTYYLERAARLDNRAVANAEVVYSPYTSQPEVEITLTRRGAEIVGELTAAHVGHKLAVLLDDRVVMAAVISGPVRGGKIIVTLGAGTADQQAAEADALVNVLRAGALPAPLREESVSRWGSP